LAKRRQSFKFEIGTQIFRVQQDFQDRFLDTDFTDFHGFLFFQFGIYLGFQF